MMKTAMITFTHHGFMQAKTIRKHRPDSPVYVPESLLEAGSEAEKKQWLQEEGLVFFASKEEEASEEKRVERKTLHQWIPELMKKEEGLIFIGATGIALRLLKDHIHHKASDPAVLVMDEQGHHVISLLSGHLGKANELTLEIAEITGAQPVITTATDNRGITAIDQLAAAYQAPLEDWETAKKWTAAMLAGEESLPVYSSEPLPLPLPAGYRQVETQEAFLEEDRGIWIGETPSCLPSTANLLQLIPRRWSLGIGCRKDQNPEELKTIVQGFLKEQGLSIKAIKNINTIQAKGEEPALLSLAKEWELPLQTFSVDKIRQVQHLFPASAWVEENMKVTSVSAPCAYLASGGGQVLPEPRFAHHGVTLSLAPEAGKITVAGIGPGKGEHISGAVKKALGESQRIIGYKPYIDRLSPWLKKGQIQDRSFMRKEKDRCRHALACAARGEKVVLVSSGDAGVYGMAGLMLELREAEFPMIPFEILPGITAANAAASRLGAPLMQDYATISLSDHLIPWEAIENRIQKATESGFMLALYNPKSKERIKQWNRAVEIISALRDPKTPVGIVTKALNEGESIQLIPLEKLAEAQVDMNTTVIIGNEYTKITQDHLMVTARGYSL